MGYEAELLSQINMNCKEFPPYAPLSDYNVFHILGISAKEVIMCRFLADLLNPEGQHGCGISFLKSLHRLESISFDYPRQTDFEKVYFLDLTVNFAL